MRGTIIILFMFVLSATIVSAKTLEQEVNVEVEFNSLSNCTSGNEVNEISIKVEGETFATYTWRCLDNDTISEWPENASNDAITPDNLDGTNYVDYLTGDVEFDVNQEDFCTEETTILYTSMRELVGNCTGALNTLTGLSQICVDNSGLAGEYRAKYDSCNADFTECDSSLISMKTERDQLNTDSVSCQKDLEVCNSQESSTRTTLSTCNNERDDYKKEADQRIMYGLGGAVIAGILVYFNFTKGKRNPDQTFDEQEFQQY